MLLLGCACTVRSKHMHRRSGKPPASTSRRPGPAKFTSTAFLMRLVCWRRAGDAPAMRRRCAGDALASFWFAHLGASDFSGDLLAIYWRFAGDLPAICWRCAGDALAMRGLRWRWVFAPLLVGTKLVVPITICGGPPPYDPTIVWADFDKVIL